MHGTRRCNRNSRCEAANFASQLLLVGILFLSGGMICRAQGNGTLPAAQPTTSTAAKGATPVTADAASNQTPTAMPACAKEFPLESNSDQSACSVVGWRQGQSFCSTTDAKLDSDIVVEIKDLKQCLAEKKLQKNGTSLRLMLDGKSLKNVVEVPDVDENYIKFFFNIDKDSAADSHERENWAEIVTAVRQSQGTGVSLSVTDPDTGYVFPSSLRIVLHLYPSYAMWVVVGMIIVLLVLLVLGAKSNLLRDNPHPGDSTHVTLPVSLGRVQMAWWFYLVVSGYLYIWLITGNSYTPTGSVLALIGISGATGLTSAVVDRSKSADAVNKRSQLAVQQSALQSRISDIAATNPAAGSDLANELAAKKDDLANVNAQLAVTPTPTVSASKGWLTDLFCDGDGVSFHRFQMIIWTIVLGVVFVQAVHRQLAMPDFDPTLLGLMGLSSGTYVGFKFPEKQK